MRVYRLEGDPDYMSAAFREWSQFKLTLESQQGLALDPEMRIALKYEFDSPEAEGVVTDCPYISPGNALTLSRTALQALEPLLLEHGAILRTEPEHEMGYEVFVCSTHLDALDVAQTEFFSTDEHYRPNEPKRYVFRPDRLGDAAIFQLAGYACRIFATDRFVQAIARHRLTGFRIRPVWSSEGGPLATLEPHVEFERYPPGYGASKREKRQAMRDYIAGRR